MTKTYTTKGMVPVFKGRILARFVDDELLHRRSSCVTQIMLLCDKQEHAVANCPAVVLPLILVPLSFPKRED